MNSLLLKTWLQGPTISFRKTHSKFHENHSRWDSSFVWLFFYTRGILQALSEHPITLLFDPSVVNPSFQSDVQSAQKRQPRSKLFRNMISSSKIGLSISISIVNIWFEDLCEEFLGYLPLLCVTWEILFLENQDLESLVKNSSCVCVVFFEDNNWKYWSFFQLPNPSEYQWYGRR